MYHFIALNERIIHDVFCILKHSRMKRNNEQLIDLLLLFDDEEENHFNEFVQMMSLSKRKKTHDMIKNRETEGAYTLLITKYLITEEDKSVKYLRVTPQFFIEF